MINHSLQLFCNRVVAAGRITAADVQVLGRDILPDGISHADEADMLIALDRAVPQSDVSYADLVSAAVVNFAVWGERPTGYVDVEIARWLVGSLRSDAGPTPLAARIAFRDRSRGRDEPRNPRRLRHRLRPPSSAYRGSDLGITGRAAGRGLNPSEFGSRSPDWPANDGE